MRKAVAIALAAVFLLASQAGAFWGGNADANGELVELFGRLDLDGPTEANVSSVERYVEGHPGEDGVDEALLRLAKISSDRKDLRKAAYFYARVIDEYPYSRFRAEASYELGAMHYRAGRLEEAASLIEPLVADSSASFSMRARAGRLLKDIEAASLGILPSSSRRAIGVLLPLKGDYASFGEEALQGVLLAAGVFGKGSSDVEVLVRDTGVDAASISTAMAELASDERVAGVVGPLLSSTAMEAAREGQRLGMPVITLSQRDGVTSAGEFVFRNFLTLEDQARALADYAASSGLKRFAVLHPQSNYGVELARHFEHAVKDLSGSVVRQAAYAPGTTDFGAEIKRIFGVKATERMEGRKKVTEFTRSVQVDALFIPDSYSAVALIVPYLDYYGITGVKLLGANGWNSPRLTELAGRSVEGAVFVDGFFAGSSRPGLLEFSARFEAAYGKAPGLISAEAYDAASMLLAASGAGDPDRESVAGRLRSPAVFSGVSGPISFNARREAQKRLFFLTVEGGRIVEAVQ